MHPNDDQSRSTELVRLSRAAAIVEKFTGERPHVATIHRWATRGLAGCKLETAYAGGYRRTSETWICQFFRCVTAAKLANTSPERSQTLNVVKAAKAELKKAGI